MAGDWMKIDLELPDKPEVHAMAGMLGIDPDAVVGKLIRVWQWFDKHTVDGNAHGVTFSLPDRITNVTGFGEAMSFVGWLNQNDKTLIMPKFDRHTSESAKSRALTAKRVAKSKLKSNGKGNAVTVTTTLPIALPREEKRREYKNPSVDSPDGFADFWAAYPKKIGKGAAQASWKKLRPPLKVCLDAIESAKRTEQWKKENGQFIPNPATWLNQKRWEDGVASTNQPDKNDLITLPDGQVVTRAQRDFVLRMMRS